MKAMRRKMLEQLVLDNLSEGSRDSYICQVSLLARHYDRCPSDLSDDEVREYMLSCRLKGDAEKTLSVRRCALKYFYSRVLGRAVPVIEEWKSNQRCRRLPVVLEIEEISKMLPHVKKLQYLLAIETIYCCGLRVSELCNLRCRDIDLRSNKLWVRNGKGNKDRLCKLPSKLSEALGKEMLDKPGSFWVLSTKKGHALSPGSLRRCLKDIGEAVNILKKYSCHTLRHSVAAHILDEGMTLNYLKEFLGHSDIRSTMIYTHLTRRGQRNGEEVIEKLYDLLTQELKDWEEDDGKAF